MAVGHPLSVTATFRVVGSPGGRAAIGAQAPSPSTRQAARSMRKYGKRPNHQTVTERNVGLAAGAFFIILAILSGMGSISLGNPVPTQGGGVSGAYLVTSYAFVLLALAFG